MAKVMCENCKYFYEKNCHRFPPGAAFPYVNPQDWCGEHIWNDETMAKFRKEFNGADK